MTLNELREIYRLVFLSDLNTSKALEKVQDEFVDSAEKTNVLDFILSSERGIMKGFE